MFAQACPSRFWFIYSKAIKDSTVFGKWLVTMVNKSSKQGCSLSKWPKYARELLTTYPNWKNDPPSGGQNCLASSLRQRMMLGAFYEGRHAKKNYQMLLVSWTQLTCLSCLSYKPLGKPGKSLNFYLFLGWRIFLVLVCKI